MTVDQIISEILRREGWPKYTNRPEDRGGPTKGGITLATLRAWRAAQPYVTAADVEALTEAEVRNIYRQRYVIGPGYAGIADDALRGIVVDCAVLYGADDASPWLQQAVNAVAGREVLTVDGNCGPKTLAAVNALDPNALRRHVLGARLRKMGRVITDDAKKRQRTEDQSLNCAGWSNRLAELLEA